MTNKKLDVTKPLIPPLSEFFEYLEQIWASQILTNKGPMHEEFVEPSKNSADIIILGHNDQGNTIEQVRSKLDPILKNR